MSMHLTPLLVVLDLDETLFHASGSTQDEENRDFFMEGYDVYKRPFVDDFLNFVFEHFKVGVFTSASCDYAQQALSQMLSNHQLEKLELVFSRERCTLKFDSFYGGLYSGGAQQMQVRKNLKKVFKKGYSKHRVMAVDDKPDNFSDSYGNCIGIKPFSPFEGTKDNELMHVASYLEFLDDKPSVRCYDHRLFRDYTR